VSAAPAGAAPSVSSERGWPYVKGHGTGNDFVLLPDPTGSLELTPSMVAAICDRRTGIGADGVLRVVPTAAVTAAELGAATDDSDLLAAEWFMDYRNADGSLAEMCGNGVRVFATYLVAAGLVPRGPLQVATRAGVRDVLVHADGAVTVGMGAATFPGLEGVQVEVGDHAPQWRDAVAVDVGNPHAVVFVDDLAEAGALRAPPPVRPPQAFPDGVNVEVARVLEPGHAAMRVHERGVGETQSCGTGACAVFAAARRLVGPDAPTRWTVDVPGGRLVLAQRGDGTVELTGPAVLVARGTLDAAWLDAARP
jgi:diaminopimelate epimerase